MKQGPSTKRGIGMSIQTIVVLVIALIILISLIVFYTRNTGNLFGSIQAMGDAGNASTDAAIAKINASSW